MQHPSRCSDYGCVFNSIFQGDPIFALHISLTNTLKSILRFALPQKPMQSVHLSSRRAGDLSIDNVSGCQRNITAGHSCSFEFHSASSSHYRDISKEYLQLVQPLCKEKAKRYATAKSDEGSQSGEKVTMERREVEYLYNRLSPHSPSIRFVSIRTLASYSD